MLETWYNVVSLAELHHIAGGATLMAHCSRESNHLATDSLNKVMDKLSHMCSV
jgi:hypothetical protein